MELTLTYQYPLSAKVQDIIKEVVKANGKLVSYSTDFALELIIDISDEDEEVFKKEYSKINTCASFQSYSRGLTDQEYDSIDWETIKDGFKE